MHQGGFFKKLQTRPVCKDWIADGHAPVAHRLELGVHVVALSLGVDKHNGALFVDKVQLLHVRPSSSMGEQRIEGMTTTRGRTVHGGRTIHRRE